MKNVHRHSPTSGIAAVRTRLGFTQESFAIALGISRVHLAMVETGKRKLTAGALLKLAELEIRLATLGAPSGKTRLAGSRPHPDSLRAREKMTARANQYMAKAGEWLHNLDAMIAQYNSLLYTVQQIESLLTAEAGDAACFTQHHLRVHRDCLLVKLYRCGPDAQALLRDKIERLQNKARQQAAGASLLNELA